MTEQSGPPYIIGITGRSGSGKTTIVRKIKQYYGTDKIAVHTMDNYYRDRPEQFIDEKGFYNFDLPGSFKRSLFHQHLVDLMSGKDLRLPQYEFNNEGNTASLIIPAAPVIIVEGLFIYHYEEIRSLLNFSVLVHLSFAESFNRRMIRDLTERNYDEVEIRHRYINHVEPAYLDFIHPYKDRVDCIIENSDSFKRGEKVLFEQIDNILGRQSGKKT